MRPALRCLLVLAGLLCALGHVEAATPGSISLTPSQDNTLFEDVSGSLSNGAGTSLFVANINNNGERRALIRFDLSTLPSAAEITGAVLALSVTRSMGAGEAEVFRLLGAWGEGTSNSEGGGGGGGASATEGDATWLHRFFPDTLWDDAGGDFLGLPSAIATIDEQRARFEAPGMIEDLRFWQRNPDQNFGWIIAPTSASDARRLSSRESGSPPTLRVDYIDHSISDHTSLVLFDPAAPGDGLYLVDDGENISVAFFGYSNARERLWLVGNQPSPPLGQPLEITLRRAALGSFLQPQDPGVDPLGEWGDLMLEYDGCSAASAELIGDDGTKTMALQALVGGASCLGNAFFVLDFINNALHGFSSDERRRIEQLSRTAMIGATRRLRVLGEVSLEVTASSSVIPETGDVGRSFAPGRVQWFVNPAHPGGVMGVAEERLEPTLFHELHHQVRGWYFEGGVPARTFMEAPISEGLATAFERDELQTEPPWGDYPEDEVDAWVEELLALSVEEGFADYGKWMIQHPDGRRWIGYRAGTYLVDRAMAASGKTAAELVRTPTEEILRFAGIESR